MKITETQLIDWLKKGIEMYSKRLIGILEANAASDETFGQVIRHCEGYLRSHEDTLHLIENGFDGPGPWDDIV